MVDIKQVFLPYLMQKDEKTLYDYMVESGFRGYLRAGTSDEEKTTEHEF